jgi:hypothetical protein
MEHLESRAFEACPCPSKEASGYGGIGVVARTVERHRLLLFVGLGSGEVAWAGVTRRLRCPLFVHTDLLGEPINIDDHAVVEVEGVRGSGNVSLRVPIKMGVPSDSCAEPVFRTR